MEYGIKSFQTSARQARAEGTEASKKAVANPTVAPEGYAAGELQHRYAPIWDGDSDRLAQ
jgi:hypothetical protein